ncbi:unnamed protein product [Phytophthora fragariaefolia]|uniref:Unnamed protein product n=1 Tax=Phytophthora fragariaefolia TaxID=1490495 RepID=A0A9W6XPR4_9STRA|nr:unnamed protein product [Phytophthora fragariaefolia]
MLKHREALGVMLKNFNTVYESLGHNGGELNAIQSDPVYYMYTITNMKGLSREMPAQGHDSGVAKTRELIAELEDASLQLQNNTVSVGKDGVVELYQP